MSIRKSIAGVVLATSLILGGTTAAFAAGGAPPADPTPAQCRAAAQRLHKLKVADSHLRADYARLVKIRNAADAAGRDQVVKVLDARLAKMKAAHTKAVARVKALATAWRAACAPAPSGTTA